MSSVLLEFARTIVTINTERLSICCLSSDDAIALSNYRSKTEVARFQSWDHFSLERAQTLIAEMALTNPLIKGQWYQVAIELSSEKKPIGVTRFQNSDELGIKEVWAGTDPANNPNLYSFFYKS